MKLNLFLLSLGLPMLLIMLTMGYLRPALRNVLSEICGTNERAEFWIRCVTMLSLFGAWVLVLAFGPNNDYVQPVDALRLVLLWTLAGAFIGVAAVSKVIWKSLTEAGETQAPVANDEKRSDTDAVLTN